MCKVLTLWLVISLAQSQTANEQLGEKELEHRLGLITEVVGKLKRQLRTENPRWFCSGEQKTKYGSVSTRLGCFLNNQAFFIDTSHYSEVDEAAYNLKCSLDNPDYPEWRKINGLGEQAIVTDGCERTWLRFNKGHFFILINGNLNDENVHARPSYPSGKLCEKGRDAISERLSETASRVAKVIDESIVAR